MSKLPPPVRLTLFWLAVILVLLFAFDRAMQLDAERLCATDLTAYEGCAR